MHLLTQCDTHRGDWLCGVQFVASLWYTPGRLTLLCAVCLFVVIHTGEIDSFVCSLSLRCDKHHGDLLCGVQFVSSLWYTPGRLTLRCAACLFIVIHTGEIDSALCSLSLCCDTHRGDWLCGVQFVCSLWYTPGRLTLRWKAYCGVSTKFEYHGEIEKDFKNILACLSGAQMC